jgi:hypothetical protein
MPRKHVFLLNVGHIRRQDGLKPDELEKVMKLG